MLLFTKHTSSLALSSRLRNSSGQYRDFVGAAWVETEGSDTKVACVEHAHAAGGTSLYLATIVVPVGGPFVWEVFITSTGEVIDYGSTALETPVASITPPTVVEIRTELDTNSTKLDAAISTRATAQQVWEYTVRALTDKTNFALSSAGLTAIRQEMDTNSTRLDVAVSTRATSQNVWEYTTRSITDKVGFSLSAAAILAIWNQLTTDGGILASTFGAKIKGWLLGTDNKVLISADPQDLSSTLDVNAKTVEDKAGYMLATVSVASPDLGMFGKGGAVGAAILDMTIEQGADFSRRVVYKVAGSPVDLTGYTARGQIRSKPSAAAALASFTITFETPRTTGAFLIELSATTSSAFEVGDDITRAENRLYYDIELVTPTTKVIRILQGRLIVSPEVTK